MDQSTLLALGFEFNCGAIDRKGKCYGRLTLSGIELTEEGRALIDELVVDEAPEAAAPVARKSKKAAPAPAPTPSIDDLLGNDPE